MNTSRQCGWLYAAIVVNLLLWLAVVGSVYTVMAEALMARPDANGGHIPPGLSGTHLLR